MAGPDLSQYGEPVDRDAGAGTEPIAVKRDDGRYYLVPTIVDGKKVSDDDAALAYHDGKLDHVGIYDREDTAITEAKRLKDAKPDLSKYGERPGIIARAKNALQNTLIAATADERELPKDEPAAPAQPTARSDLPDPFAKPFDPTSNTADAVALDLMAKKAQAEDEAKQGPMRPGPTIERSDATARADIEQQATTAAPDIKRAKAAAAAVNSYTDMDSWTESHPLQSSISSGIAQGLSGLGDFAWAQAEEAQRKVNEGKNPLEADDYWQQKAAQGVPGAREMQAFSVAGGVLQEGLRQLLFNDKKGAPERLQWAENLDYAANVLKPQLTKLSADEAASSHQFLKWLIVQEGQQAPNHAMMVATMLAPSIAPLTLPTMGAQSGGQQYAENRTAGVRHDEAYIDAMANATAEVAGEGFETAVGFVGGKAILKVLRGIPLANREAAATAIMARALKSTGILAGGMTTGAMGEAATQYAQDTSQEVFTGRDAGDKAANARTAAAIGAFGQGVSTVAHAGGRAVMEAGAPPSTPEGIIAKVLNEAKLELPPGAADLAATRALDPGRAQMDGSVHAVLAAQDVSGAIEEAERALVVPTPPHVYQPELQGQQQPDTTDLRMPATGEPPAIEIPGAPAAPTSIPATAPDTRSQYADALVKQQRGELLTPYETTLLANPPETPALVRTDVEASRGARDPQAMTQRELEQAAKLTRSPERRTQLEAEIDRRTNPENANGSPESGTQVPAQSPGQRAPNDAGNGQLPQHPEAVAPSGAGAADAGNHQRTAAEEVAPTAGATMPQIEAAYRAAGQDRVAASVSAQQMSKTANDQGVAQTLWKSPAGELQVAPATAPTPSAGSVPLLTVHPNQALSAPIPAPPRVPAAAASPAKAAAVQPASPTQPAAATAAPENPGKIAEDSAKSPEFRDYVEPRADRGRGVKKNELREWKTQKLASAFAKAQKLRGYTARQVEGGAWRLSRPPLTSAQIAAQARLARGSKQVRPHDSLGTMLRKWGGAKASDFTRDGADPADIRKYRPFSFVNDGGLSLGAIAERMAEQGFDVYDEHGAVDDAKARELVQEEIEGTAVYTAEGHEIRASQAQQRRERGMEPTAEETKEGEIHDPDDNYAEHVSMLAQAVMLDEAHVEALAVQFSDDEAGFLHAVEESLNDQDHETASGRKARSEAAAREEGGSDAGTPAQEVDKATAIARVADAAAQIRAAKPGDIGPHVQALDLARTAAERAGASTREIVQAMEGPQPERRPMGPERLADMLEKGTSQPPKRGVESETQEAPPHKAEVPSTNETPATAGVSASGTREFHPELDAKTIERLGMLPELDDFKFGDRVTRGTRDGTVDSLYRVKDKGKETLRALVKFDAYRKQPAFDAFVDLDKLEKKKGPVTSVGSRTIAVDGEPRYRVDTMSDGTAWLYHRDQQGKWNPGTRYETPAEAEKDATEMVAEDAGEQPHVEQRPELDLTGETAAEIRAREAQQAKAAEEERKKAAAPEPADFTLTGSDRPADVARARGQMELDASPMGQAASALRNAADAIERSMKPQGEIADFGEKIGGARKDVWATMREDMDKAQQVDVETQPLSKSWPAPDYQKLLDSGADPWAVAFMHAARDEIPPKPRAPWKAKRWAEQVHQLRDVAFALARGEMSGESARTAINELANKSRGFADVMGRIALYQLVGHAKSLEGVRISSGQYGLFEGKQYDPPKVIWTVEKEAPATAYSNWPRILAKGDTREDALANFKAAYDGMEITKPASSEVSFEIYSKRSENGYWVGKKIGRNPLLLAGPFTTVKEARAYKTDNQAELVAKLDKAKEIPSERRDTNEPRVGVDMRNGQDVTPQMFGETFGFRGVEFGNWVEQGRRQRDLNDAFDALMDMAAILDIPPKAISLNGELGLAFGARGSGGKQAAAAHYERDRVVINLTKTQGAGSLGHEWWHALDNYFSRLRAKPDDYLTEALDTSLASRDSNFAHQGEVRREMVEAFGQVVKAIRNTALKARSSRLDAKRSKEYWTTTREMTARAFESYLISKLQDQNASNDYLANIVSEATWKATESMGFELEDSYPYPTAGEVPAIRAGFEHFFQTVESRESGDDVALYRRGHEEGSATVDTVHDWLAPTIEKTRVPIRVVQDAADLPWEAPSDAKGAYYRGRIWVVASNIESAVDAERTVARHEVTHAGIDIIYGSGRDRARVLQTVVAKNRALRELASSWRAQYGEETKAAFTANGMSEDEARRAMILESMEEALAHYSEESGNELTGWQSVVAQLQKGLRAIGLDNLADWLESATHAEVRAFLAELRQATQDHLAGAGREQPAFHRAYHGSPHDFDRFDIGKIGTGEGAQAYGYGLYFAGRKEVADHYKRSLSGGVVYRGQQMRHLFSTEGMALGVVADFLQRGRSFAEAKAEAIDHTERLYKIQGDYVEQLKERVGEPPTPGWGTLVIEKSDVRAEEKKLRQLRQRLAITKELKDGDLSLNNGRLYEVELAPKEEEYLDWDKPLNQQSDKVREAINRIPKEDIAQATSVSQEYGGAMKRGELTGESLYMGLVHAGRTTTEAVSRALAAVGIPGIRYLDGSSRSKGEGHHNYVIFDDKHVDVVAKYARRLVRSDHRTVNDFVVPDTKEYDGNTTGDLARITAAAAASHPRIEALPIRLTAGESRGEHRGWGLKHLKAETDLDQRRAPRQHTDDLAENYTRDVAEIARTGDKLFYDRKTDRVVLMGRSAYSLVLERRTDPEGNAYYSVVTMFKPTDVRKQWGSPVWVGRAELPTTESPKSVAPGPSPGVESRPPDRQPLGVQAEQFQFYPDKGGGEDGGGSPPKYARTGGNQRQVTRGTGAWAAPVESRLDDITYRLQDKHVDTKRVISAISQAQRAIADDEDPYLKEELYHGRAAKAVDDFLNDELKPLMKDMASHDVAIADFEEWLHARHAQERNTQIASINPGLPDGGSGMTNTEAAQILAAARANGKDATYRALAAKVDAITAGTRQAMIDYKLEEPAAIAAWQAAYQNYVPLQREDMEGGMGIGQGFSVRGGQKRATGSQRAVVDILANVAMQRERTIARGEKAIVGRALLGLAVANPNPDFWRVDQPPMVSRVAPRTGLVTQAVDPTYRSRDNVFMVRTVYPATGAVDHAVVFNEHDPRAMRMAAALKNLDANEMGVLLTTAAKFTRYFASINTQYNPVFGVVNLTRDIQEGMLNLSSTPLAGAQKDVAKNALSALRGIYIDLRDHRNGVAPSSSWAQLFEEFQKTGGQTGYRDLFRTSEDRTKALEREIKKARAAGARSLPRSAWDFAFDWLSDYNEAMENAVRLAAYKVGRDRGLSKDRAASLAKNLTVNFNRKGQITTQAGSLYAFFNANVQGAARNWKTLAGPAGKRIIAGGVMLGVLQALALSMAGFDDDEPPEFVREKNIIIPIGGKKYVTIPMPLGFSVIPNIGRIPTEFLMRGMRNPGKRLSDFFGVLADAYNPLGSAGVSMQTIAPTILDPFAALAENKDWTGRPIARVDTDALHPTPGHTRAKDVATPPARWLAKAINLVTGGTKYKPGALSPTPDQIDYLLGQFTGGVGREGSKLLQTASSFVTGEDLPPYKIPLVGRIYGDAASATSHANTFYDNVKDINEHAAELRGRRKNGEPIGDYYRDNPEAKLVGYAQAVERQVAAMRKEKRALVEKDAPRAQVKAVEDRIGQRMQQFNTIVKRTRDAPAEATP